MMNKIIIPIAVLASLTTSSWVLKKRYNGYFPTGTYPLNLQAGDHVKITVFDATVDKTIDLYLYAPGTDISSNSGLGSTVTSGTNKILTHTVSSAGTYHARVDLQNPDHSAEPYRIRILVNNQE